MRPLLLLLPFLSACGTPGAAPTDDTPAKEVNVYSHRHYDTDAQLFKAFTAATGIRVNLVMADDDEVLTRMEQEGANSPCDLLITSDAGRLGQARMRGLLQPIRSAELERNIPPFLRDPDGHWFGLTMRARVFVYNKNKVRPEQLTDYNDLVRPEWKGRVLVRSAENLYNQSLLAAMVAHFGTETALAWATGITVNMARTPKGSDTDQLLAVAEGIGDVAIANSYYVGKLMSSSEPEKAKARENLAVAFPHMGPYGTHVNVSGAGVAKSAKHLAEAIALLEFLVGEEAQRLFAEGNKEYPVRPGVAVADVLQRFGELTPDTLDLAQLGLNNATAVKLFDKAGWR
ncbi:MAG: Fe(3+) ABC transporter substrate-binding protein [Flavobacteriales bacterium]|jgi:iron(III) transport system substrate-binding protein|nr:Fe(3+) ABC transporter substrate-binding protein [Flavobacteriales bacterium]MBK7085176.1 Fe(3+) ABC transporter substrate-binding protein [Flavobacteriales bacterium]MBK7270209.1 Fe(3+) ABC transporter substrate-binding protein [Flavobacteriales bacterium]MBK7754066.1 Fe(3+) ABC transporter substrate-binding protein [Flavobacteriales bacterium]MBK9075882.1 Fe(3+) ABC transporter substrate-binding protein [Flavobacteriales bacterium]